MVMLVTSLTAEPVFLATWAMARLWSRRIIAVKRSARDVGSVALGDQAVGVGRVTDHQHLDVRRGTTVQRLALWLEDPTVGLEQVTPLHALAARPGSDEQGDVDAVEGLLGIVVDVDAGEQREGAVVELHRGALGGLDGVRDLEQRQVDFGCRDRAAGRSRCGKGSRNRSDRRRRSRLLSLGSRSRVHSFLRSRGPGRRGAAIRFAHGGLGSLSMLAGDARSSVDVRAAYAWR